MAPRPAWWHQLQASKAEALLAVDVYNRPGDDRRLEAFVIHMQIAWLYLLHARFRRDGTDYWYRDDRGRRIRGRDGEFRTRELAYCLKQVFPNGGDPVRRNVAFFIGLRNKIEHRYEGPLGDVVSGRCQSLILNYEAHLVSEFGSSESLGRRLRLPVFLSSLSDDAVTALKQTYRRLPKKLTSYIETYDAGLDEAVRNDWRYEFRVVLVPVTSPKTEADVAMQFVRLNDLTDEVRGEVERALTIVREKLVPVQHRGAHKAGAVAGRVAEALNCSFALATEHVRCWKYYKVRPLPGAKDPAATDCYCLYDEAHGDYVYTDAWIEKLIIDLADTATFIEVIGKAARPPRARRNA